MKKTSAAAVIIPTRGRNESLRQTLRDLDLQSFKEFEVWVIDQNDQALVALEKEISTVNFYHEKMKPKGSHAGRNHAIARVEARVCIFVDDDVRLEPDFVERHVHAHEILDSKYAVIAGKVVQPKDGLSKEASAKQGKMAKYHPLTGMVSGNFIGENPGKVDHFHECNFSARTEVLRQVGGFNEAFAGNAYFEGTDLALRIIKAGYSIIYRPEISLVHLQDDAGGNRLKQKAKHTYWMMRNQGLLNSEHMHLVGLPLYVAYGLGYVISKSIKNHDREIFVEGLSGIKDGLLFFVPKIVRKKIKQKR